MRKLMFAFACAASAAAFADTLGNSATFEDIGVGSNVVAYTDSGASTGTLMWQYAAETTDDETAVAALGGTRPVPSGSSSTKYLELATNGAELQRKVNDTGTAQTVGDGIYIDTMVQFTATPDAPDFSSDTSAKLAIWLEGDEGSYALKALGGAYYMPSGSQIPSVTQAVYTVSGTYAPDTWYRLTVKAVGTITETGYFPGFQIRINGTLVSTIESCYDADAYTVLSSVAASNVGLLTEKTFVPSAKVTDIDPSTAPTLTTVGFQGSGAIDDLTITDDDLFPPAPSTVQFTIDLGANVSSATYTIDGGAGTTVSADTTVDVAIGTVVAVTGATAADWYLVTLPAAVTAAADATNITVSASPTQVDPTTITDGNVAATAVALGVNNAAFTGTAADLSKVVAWAEAKGVSTATVNSMTFDGAGNPSGSGDALAAAEAYLLDCTVAGLADAKAAFTVSGIAYVNGAWVVTPADNAAYGNGKIDIRGSATLTNPTWSAENTTGPFFKAFLVK